MPFVYSTLTGDNLYCEFHHNPLGISKIKKKVLIKGGANVAQTRMIDLDGAPIHTFSARETEVSDEELVLLENNQVFKRQESKGFLLVQKKSIPVNKALEFMTNKDKSAPKTPGDFIKDSRVEGIKKSKDGADTIVLKKTVIE